MAISTTISNRRLVVRNGHAVARPIVTGAGPIVVQAPRVNDRRVDEVTGERSRFTSSILTPWCSKSPKVADVLPLMYPHGMSSGDFAPALSEFFGSAAGLSAPVVTRLTVQWQQSRPPWPRPPADRSTRGVGAGDDGDAGTPDRGKDACDRQGGEDEVVRDGEDPLVERLPAAQVLGIGNRERGAPGVAVGGGHELERRVVPPP